MLEVRALSKSFGGFAAISDVALSVERGQIFAIIGPNGAGKSTLFNLVTGHVKPSAGSVLFEGRDITGVAPHRLCAMGMGRSFQRSNIFPRLTVFENVQAALIAHRGRGRDFWSKSAEVLIMVILGGIGSFWGPAVGAAALTLLNHQITAVTQYWPLVLGIVLIVLLFVFPGGLLGALSAGAARWKKRNHA